MLSMQTPVRYWPIEHVSEGQETHCGVEIPPHVPLRYVPGAQSVATVHLLHTRFVRGLASPRHDMVSYSVDRHFVQFRHSGLEVTAGLPHCPVRYLSAAAHETVHGTHRGFPANEHVPVR